MNKSSSVHISFMIINSRYNWMILDSVHLLYEAGFDVLPNNINPLKQGWVRPPNAMDGIPAPLSITVNPEDTIISKVSIFENIRLSHVIARR